LENPFYTFEYELLFIKVSFIGESAVSLYYRPIDPKLNATVDEYSGGTGSGICKDQQDL